MSIRHSITCIGSSGCLLARVNDDGGDFGDGLCYMRLKHSNLKAADQQRSNKQAGTILVQTQIEDDQTTEDIRLRGRRNTTQRGAVKINGDD